MKISDCVDFVNQIEKKYSVSQWVVNGIHIWPIIRIRLASELQCINSEESLSKPNTNNLYWLFEKAQTIIRRFTSYLYAYIADYQHNSRLKDEVDAVFLNNLGCRRYINNCWYDVFCDPFIDCFEKLKMKSFVLEWANYGEYRIPRFRNSMFIQPVLDYLKIKNKLFRNDCQISLEGYNSFLDDIEPLKIDSALYSVDRLKYEANVIRSMADYYKQILTKLKPSFGFVSIYYEPVDMAFILACRELGIVSVDIQHGCQGEFHVAYGNWLNVPESGYELLPAVFWNWSELEANAIKKWSTEVSQWHKPVAGGNLFLNTWLQIDHKLVKYYDELWANTQNITSDSVNILYSVQTVSTPNDDVIPEWLLQAIKGSPANWNWWIRLHPGQLAEKTVIKDWLQEKIPSRFEIDLSSEMPLPALLRNIDVHVTKFSSVILEAASFGIPSVVIHEDANHIYPEQIASGWAIPAFTPQGLINAVQIQLSQKDKFRVKETNFSTPEEIVNLLFSKGEP